MIIKYFAWIKDITNKDYDIFDKNFPKNIDELNLVLIYKYPDLKKHIRNNILRYAINMEYVSTNKKLNSTDEIAIFPQVSGG
tara:strand:+ start:316 stop:561 length:246 start_codon:yes stop_codon:yes gene_type:complete